jgi:uncharacterized membrane protein
MHSELFYEPLLYVYPTHSSLCYRPANRSFVPVRNREKSNENLSRRVVNGVITPPVAKKIKNALGWHLLFAKEKWAFNEKKQGWFKFKTSMVTLTLPCQQYSSDKWIKRKLFNAWMTYARKYFGLKNYVWRAEAQANGNIHFHVIVDVYIDYKLIRSAWNRICNANGYCYNGEDGYDANGTDIHSIGKVKDILAYMTKYCTKNDESRRLIDGALWGCSDSLKKLGACVVSASGYVRDKLNDLCTKGVYKSYTSDRCFIVKEKVQRILNDFRAVKSKLIDHYSLYLGRTKSIINEKINETCLKPSLQQLSHSLGSYQLPLGLIW